MNSIWACSQEHWMKSGAMTMITVAKRGNRSGMAVSLGRNTGRLAHPLASPTHSDHTTRLAKVELRTYLKSPDCRPIAEGVPLPLGPVTPSTVSPFETGTWRIPTTWQWLSYSQLPHTIPLEKAGFTWVGEIDKRWRFVLSC